MFIRHKRGWELPENTAIDEAVFRDRRRLIQALAAGPILAPALLRAGSAFADADPSAVGSSRVDLQACKLEYSIVSPK